MIKSKGLILRFVLALELFIFGTVYFWGVDGLGRYQAVCGQNKKLEGELRVLQQELKDLEEQIGAWSKDPFFKEKIAREQLQMACVDDEVLFIK